MKKALSAAVIVAAFVLPGCAAGGAEKTAAPAPVATAAPIELTVDETCEQLMGANADGPLIEASVFLREVEDSSEFDEAAPLHQQLTEIAEQAPASMKSHVEAIVVPFDDMVNPTSDTWVLDADSYKAAGNELIATCSDYMSGIEPSDMLLDAATEEDSLITGDIEADLSAAGVESDDYQETLDSLALVVCRDYSLIDGGKAGWDEVMSQMGTLFNNGDWNSTVQIIAAYECPDRAEDVEEHLI